MSLMSTDFRGISSQAAHRLLRYSTVLLTTAPLRLCSTVFLHIQDGLLPEEDQHLPFAGHVVSTLQHPHFVEDFVFVVFMGAQKVIVSDPERNAVYCTAIRTVTAGDTIRFPECTVQAFDHLFEWPEFFGYFVVIGKADHLRDEYVPAFFNLELLGGKRIRAVSVSNEFQGSVREFLKFIKCHAHGKNTGADIS